MRMRAIDLAQEKFLQFGVNPRVEALDVGGAPVVSLAGVSGSSPNPVAVLSPRVSYLDKGFLRDADYEVDFLNLSVILNLRDRFPLVYCFYTIEHVEDPFLWCRHLMYVTKPSGHVWVSAPWICGYHPSPEDYWRFSPAGLRLLFKGIGKVLWAGWEDEVIENEIFGSAILVQKGAA